VRCWFCLLFPWSLCASGLSMQDTIWITRCSFLVRLTRYLSLFLHLGYPTNTDDLFPINPFHVRFDELQPSSHQLNSSLNLNTFFNGLFFYNPPPGDVPPSLSFVLFHGPSLVPHFGFPSQSFSRVTLSPFFSYRTRFTPLCLFPNGKRLRFCHPFWTIFFF